MLLQYHPRPDKTSDSAGSPVLHDRACSDALAAPTDSAPTTAVTVADTQPSLDLLPIKIMAKILCSCFLGEDAADEAGTPFSRALTVCHTACTCKAFRVAAGEDVWYRGFEREWGKEATTIAKAILLLPKSVAKETATGPEWAQAYARGQTYRIHPVNPGIITDMEVFRRTLRKLRPNTCSILIK